MGGTDVIVIGGGNAGLCAALAAAAGGAHVRLVDCAPAETPGGNSSVTPGKIEIGRYTEDEFLGDLQRVTHGKADPGLAQALVSGAFPTMRWLRRNGVGFTLAYDRQSFLVDGRHTFWGGLIVKTQGVGPGLIDALLHTATTARVGIEYAARATNLHWDTEARQWRVHVTVGDLPREHHARAVVPKSNWAQRLDSLPYACFPVTCGITFTFGGVKITPQAEVVGLDGRVIAGLFACGELAAGLFYHNYPGGSGLMAGAVFGRAAGAAAAAHAKRAR